MANYFSVHNRISKGRGKAAVRVGQIFTVTRLTNHGFIELAPSFKCLLRRLLTGHHIEQRQFLEQSYELVCDVRKLQVGDLLEEKSSTRLSQKRFKTRVVDRDTQISAVGGALGIEQSWAPVYYVAQFRPVHKFIGIRMEHFVQVRRGNFPDVENGDGGYQQQGENAEALLTLNEGTGVFEFIDINTPQYPEESEAITPAPSPVLIPMGLEPALVRGTPPFDLPMDWGINKWHFAMPGAAQWMNGWRIQENDYIIHPDGNRFRVLMVWEQHVGMEIIQGMLEKLES